MNIAELHEALRLLLIRELPVTNNEIDIAFEQPRREWSARLNRPTLNLYLHDIRENNKLRGQQPGWSTEIRGNRAHRSRQPLSIDLHYMITAWTNYPEDEHNLLMRTLRIFFRHGELPEEIVQASFRMLPHGGVGFQIAQYEMHVNPRDLWSVLDNEMRPALDLVTTIPFDPDAPLDDLPLVREIETSLHVILPDYNEANQDEE